MAKNAFQQTYWGLGAHLSGTLIVVSTLILAGCTVIPLIVESHVHLPSVRFLLTFDDGPSSIIENDNPTGSIANTLASNPIQPGIKAIFFIQTRSPTAGGSDVGRRLLQRLVADGHVLSLHSGASSGHINHRTMNTTELAGSLIDGVADIAAIGSKLSGLVRPPFWAFDNVTMETYDRVGLTMLLTDLRARDGYHWIYQTDPDTGGKMRDDFDHFRGRLINGRVPLVDGVAPVVVTFHDVSAYTAAHLQNYLSTLLNIAGAAGFKVAEPPFYADQTSLLQAARARASNSATRADLAP